MKMVSVVLKFSHGGQTFHPGELRLVSEEDAAYFIKHKWAKNPGAPDPVAADTSPKELEVQNVTHVNRPTNA